VTQQPPGSPPGPPPGPPYGAPQYAGGYVPPDHPQASTVLVLGILGIAVCGVVGPFAWVMGNRVIREIDASGGQLGGRSNANAGRIMGMVGTGMMAIGLLLGAGLVIIALLGVLTSSTT